MNVRPLSREEVRSIDATAADWGLPTLVLMENAGRGAAHLLAQHAASDARILVACGPGNNGGDGAVLARHWDALGGPVRVVWFTRKDKLSGNAAAQHRILEHADIDQTIWDDTPDPVALDALFAGADWIVDALLGTGLTRPVEGTLREVIGAINRSGKPVLSLDLPSGLDADLGMPCGVAVRATFTATFVAPKTGFSAPGADAYIGSVDVVDIGVPRQLLERLGSLPKLQT